MCSKISHLSSKYDVSLTKVPSGIEVKYTYDNGVTHTSILSENLEINRSEHSYLNDIDQRETNDPRILWSSRLNNSLDFVIFEEFVSSTIIELAGVIAHRLFVGDDVPSQIIISGDNDNIWSNGTKEIFITEEHKNSIIDQEYMNIEEMLVTSLLN